MKSVLAFALIFLLVVGGLSVWVSLNALNSASPNNPATANSSEDPVSIAKQVIENIKPKGPLAPEIVSNTWFNSPALAAKDLRGKVVVVEFWTYG